MKLLPDWKWVVRKAWSVRLMVLAAILTGCEAVVTVTGVEWIPLPAWARLALVFVVISGAFIARLVVQREDDDD